jgi:DNA-directed RNA polymerase specialized sigma24 family protein
MATRGHAARWELTASALQQLLARLDADPVRAAEAYETLRLGLTRFFDWRGAHFPDECADEVLNRLARRLDEGAAIDEPRGFALGIARLVLLERARSPQARHDALDEARVGAAPPPEAEPSPHVQRCLDACLSDLAPEARTLILEYYRDERRGKIDRRARLAAQLGLSASALRSRAQRVRDRLERCVRDCAARLGADTNPRGVHLSTDDGP